MTIKESVQITIRIPKEYNEFIEEKISKSDIAISKNQWFLKILAREFKKKKASKKETS